MLILSQSKYRAYMSRLPIATTINEAVNQRRMTSVQSPHRPPLDYFYRSGSNLNSIQFSSLYCSIDMKSISEHDLY